jgi:hypothetical protein
MVNVDYLVLCHVALPFYANEVDGVMPLILANPRQSCLARPNLLLLVPLQQLV